MALIIAQQIPVRAENEHGRHGEYILYQYGGQCRRVRLDVRGDPARVVTDIPGIESRTDTAGTLAECLDWIETYLACRQADVDRLRGLLGVPRVAPLPRLFPEAGPE